MSKNDKLSGSINFLKNKANKSSEEIMEMSYWEVLKKSIGVCSVGVIYILIAIAGNDVLDISKVQGVIFIFGLLAVMTLLFYFWKKDQSRFAKLQKTSKEDVQLVTADMRIEMNKMKDELIDNFKATIDAYQTQVNNLVYDVVSERRRVQRMLKPNQEKRKTPSYER